MSLESDWSTTTVSLAIGSLGAIAMVPGGLLLAAETSVNYPDVPNNYWATPYIYRLTQANILTGYLDGTFRPEQTIDRDEYAAVLRQAFDEEPVRSIPNADSFRDVPQGYWANPAIEEAYETGFLGTPTANQFEPQSTITRAEAIVALMEGLDFNPEQAESASSVDVATASTQSTRQPRKAKNQLLFPLASTSMMQIFKAPAPTPQSTKAQNPSKAAQVALPASSSPSSSTISDGELAVNLDLDQYYIDAQQIPDDAKDDVAIATLLGVVVNHPDPQRLNPNQPMLRGEAAALVYQVLAQQGDVEPLPLTAEGRQYVVSPTATP